MGTPKAELEKVIKGMDEVTKDLYRLKGIHPDHERDIEVYEAAKLYSTAAKLALKEGDINAARIAIELHLSCIRMYEDELSLFLSSRIRMYRELRTDLIKKYENGPY